MCLIINSTSPPSTPPRLSHFTVTAHHSFFVFPPSVYLYTVSFVRYFYRLTADTRSAVFTLFFSSRFFDAIGFFFQNEIQSSSVFFFLRNAHISLAYVCMYTCIFRTRSVSRRKRRRRYARPTGIATVTTARRWWLLCSVVEFARTPKYPVLVGTRRANPTIA